jgi:predicted DCC family thiol-disulfide oxidoreductase YuxK
MSRFTMHHENSIVLFDGVCNYCNSMVNFIIRQDKKKTFRFAALQSEAGQTILKEHGLPLHDFDSFILLSSGKIYQNSTAALKLYHQLPWYWQWTQAFWIFPRFLRDGLYRIIAKNRYRWFGKRAQCRIPSAEDKERFLL